MADHRLRQLEREAAGGGPEARGRLLRERVRTGELPQERLRLAAHVGDPAARWALGDPSPELAPPEAWVWRAPLEEELPAWARHLSGWGAETCARAALAVAVLARSVYADAAPRDRWPDLVVGLGEARVEAGGAPIPDRSWLEAYERSPQPRAPGGHVLFWAGECFNAERWSWEPLRTGEGAVDAALERAVVYAAEVAGARRVRAAIEEGLRPWALAASPG